MVDRSDYYAIFGEKQRDWRQTRRMAKEGQRGVAALRRLLTLML